MQANVGPEFVTRFACKRERGIGTESDRGFRNAELRRKRAAVRRDVWSGAPDDGAFGVSADFDFAPSGGERMNQNGSWTEDAGFIQTRDLSRPQFAIPSAACAMKGWSESHCVSSLHESRP